MAIAAAVVMAAGAVYSGIQQKKAADFNAEVSEQNAIAAENKAKFDEDIHRDRVKQLLSKQRATIGKSGVTSEGTPLLATLDTVEKGELDALAIRYGGDVAAGQQRSSAKLSKLQGKTAMTSSLFKAGSSLLTGLK